MLTLVNRVSTLGVAVVVAVGLALVAIAEQAILPSGHPAQRQEAAPAPQTARSKPHPSRRSRTPKPVSPDLALSHQVKQIAAKQRAPIAKREYGVGSVASPTVRISRMDRDQGWAFGAETIPAPTDSVAVPESSLFLAHATGSSWKVALVGTKEFGVLLKRAPDSVLPAAERGIVTRYATTMKAKSDTGLMLPWTIGESWSLVSTANRTLGVDGGDENVVAAGDGVLYRLCSTAPDRALIIVLHPNGLASVYDQMEEVTSLPDGSGVKQGDYLGRAGTQPTCGGAPTSHRMALFALRDASGTIPLNMLKIAGWTLHSSPTGVFADRAGVRVDAGNPLLNFGDKIDLPTPTPTPSKKSTPKPSKVPRILMMPGGRPKETT
jgi:hypothetical protein